jgi:RimJ/RimL family protein N-acetyltransferase
MTLHTGPSFCEHTICIGTPDLGLLGRLEVAPDVRDAAAFYLSHAPTRPDIYYFGVFHAGRLIGQILLHDIDEASGESLVAYHVFQAADRSRGFGTIALGLLQGYVQASQPLRRLVIITSRDNSASQRIAAKCGFKIVGPAREDPDRLLVFAWDIPGRAARPG